MSANFKRFIGIDYSGAQHCDAGLSGIRVFEARFNHDEVLELRPTESERVHWSRSTLAHWLHSQLSSEKDGPILVGIDHALSFPIEYFALHGLEQNWDTFLSDFCSHWPADLPQVTVRTLLEEHKRVGASRLGNARWRRLAEQKSRGAKSVFHFGVPGAVASSTHAGLPWIRFLRNAPALSHRIHFWPFDGWTPSPSQSVISEVYPALWNKSIPRGALSQDQHDARTVALSLKTAAANGELLRWFSPENWERIRLSADEKSYARIEGWILGLT